MSDIPQYKVLLVGDTGVDEWSFLRMWKSYAHAAYDDPLSGLKTYPIQFTTNLGKKQLNFVSLPRRDMYSFDDDNVASDNVDAVILMIDDARFNNAWRWHLKLLLEDLNIPVVSCIISRSIEHGMNTTYKASSSRALYDGRRPGMTVHETYRPLLWLVRKLCADKHINWSEPLEVSAPPSKDDDLSHDMNNMALGSSPSSTGSIHFTPGSTETGISHEQDHISGSSRSSPVISQTTEDDVESFGVFVMCIHCVRMILIKSPITGRLANIFQAEMPYSLATTICRSCSDTKGPQLGGSLPYNVLKHTRMSDVAKVVAGQQFQTFMADNDMTWSTALDSLSNNMDTDCCIYGIRMDDDTLHRVNKLEAEDLRLEYVPGAFL